MVKIICVLTTMQLSIIISTVNLIRYGDFQNLITIQESGWDSCRSICNGIWSASKGEIQIVSLGVGYIGNQIVYTNAVDMQNFEYFQLCQNISSVEVGSIYQFTFDMHCQPLHSSCSIWTIINNEVVNGSNHTMNDHLFHKIQGYFNSTRSDNQICFQSRNYPEMQSYGAMIDNITFQYFNSTIPCNVAGCQLCVLNFPDSCSVCLNNSIKQQNQTCTTCSIVITNCVRCQFNSNQYVCLQCESSFQLDNQNRSCFQIQILIPSQRQAQVSEIVFKSQVQQTSSIYNSFMIKTNLSIALLAQAGFTVQNLPSIIIEINSQRQQNLTTTINQNGFLEVKINLLHSYQSFQITFEIQQGFLSINNTLFPIRTSVYGKPSTSFFSETQILILQKSDQIAKPILQTLDASFAVIKSSGFGYFVANIFNFVNLMKNYAYLRMYQPKSFKLFIEKLTAQLNSFSFYKLINFQDQVYQAGIYNVTEKIEASKTQWSGPLQGGFSTNFYSNNLQPFTFIVVFVIRLAICWLLYKIFKVSFFQISNSQRFISVSSQFHSIIPIIILPSFNLIMTQIASINYVEKINTSIQISILFVCLMMPFVHLITNLQQIQRRFQKDIKKLQSQIKKYNKNGKIEDLQLQIQPLQADNQQAFKAFNERRNILNQRRKDEFAQTKYKLFQRLTLLSIPIFVVFVQVVPFLLVNLCILLICFVLSLRLRKYFSTYQFLFNAIINLIWVLYHCTFCAYFIIQKWLLDQQSSKQVEEISKYIGYSSVAIILFGAVIQILDCLIGFVLKIKQVVLFIYKKIKKCKQIVPQAKNSSKIKNKNAFNPKINKRKDPSIGKKLQVFFSEQISKNENKTCKSKRYCNNQPLKIQQVLMEQQKKISPNFKDYKKRSLKIKKIKGQIKNKHNQLMVKFKHQD